MSSCLTLYPSTAFGYTSSPYCNNGGIASPTFGAGALAGTFSASPSGLSINATTGKVNLSLSTPGTYTVTNAFSLGCETTATITVLSLPTAAIAYPASPFCNTITTGQVVTQTDTLGGTYTASPAGLAINAINGSINPSASIVGTYTITYSISTGNGCPAVTATTTVTIKASSVATFRYVGSPYCSTAANPLPAFSGGGVAGTFSASPAGLSINATTGKINLVVSTPGTYTVTNIVTGACGTVAATTTVTIKASPVATFSYVGSPYCNTAANPLPTFSGGGAAGTFSASPAGLSINATTGKINLVVSTPGTYTVTNIVTGACGTVAATTTVTIKASPVATFSYVGSPYCNTAANPLPTFSGGGAAGTFSASPAGLSINATTGKINLTVSTSGTYTITNTVTGACATATHTSIFTERPKIRDSVTTQRNVNCNEGDDGSAAIGVRRGVAPYTYLWDPTGKTTISVTGLSAGTYTVNVTDKYNCGGVAVKITITQPPALAANISSSCQGTNDGTLGISLTGGKSPYTYSWAGGETKSSLTGLSNGLYQVILKDNNGCIDTALLSLNCPEVSASNLNDHQEENNNSQLNNIVLYPNPNNGQCNIVGIQKGMRIEIYDYTGKMVYTLASNGQTMQVNLPSYNATGIYLIRILDENGILVSQKKMMKIQ